jgi:short-subunit dehydrogenase
MIMNGSVIILGPTSGIGCAVAHEMAMHGKNLVLAGRDTDEIQAIAADLRIRHNVRVVVRRFDAMGFDGHASFIEHCWRDAASQGDPDPEGLILCYGDMTDQDEAENDFSLARRVIDVNYTSCVSVLNRAAMRMKQAGQGYLCVVSSVAGDRGRQSNYTYGSSKAALSVYLQGLRNRLFSNGVHVVTVKPGFVDTGMTWGLLKPGSPLVAGPAKVARDIRRAIERRRNVVYTPWFWFGIMMIIRSIPEPIFKRLKL